MLDHTNVTFHSKPHIYRDNSHDNKLQFPLSFGNLMPKHAVYVGNSLVFETQRISPARALWSVSIRAGGPNNSWNSDMYLDKCCRDDNAPGLLPLAVWTHWSPLSCLQLRAAEPALSSCSSRQMEPLCPQAPPAHSHTRIRWTAAGHGLSTSPIASLSFHQ